MSSAANRDKPVLSAVTALLNRTCPTAILFAIIAIGINPVQCAFARTLAHVSEKCLKIQPFLAYGNSSTSVILVRDIIWAGTSSNHPAPCVVCPGWRTFPARVSMFCHSCAGLFAFQTAARSRCSVSQRASLNRFLRPTLAPAQPVRFFLPGWGNRGVRIPEDRKPAEHATSEINQSRHRTISEGKSHREGNGAATRRWLRVSGATLAAPHISIPQKPSLENTTFGVRDG